MRELPFDDSTDATQKRSPNDARQYINHDKKIEERYRPGPLKSIEKEIEGMARLIAAVDGKINEETMKTLLQSFREERSQLREIEDRIQRNHTDK